jgi:streptogramin lyase/two-component sensor histidine kinase
MMLKTRSLPILLLLLSTAAAAQQTLESFPMEERQTYSRRVWRSVDGLPEDFAQSAAQTPDGYLWIGTSGGLVRFDGANFTVFNRENSPAFRDDSVYSLLVARDGALWAGTEGGGLLSLRNGDFQVFGPEHGLENGFVRVIYEDHAGRLWVGTDTGLFRKEADRFVRIDGRRGIPKIHIHAICEDRKGRLLVGGGGLLILDGDAAVHFSSEENQADNNIRTIRQTADGAIWLGAISGLRKIPETFTGNPFQTPRLLSNVNISFLLEGSRGDLWIGSYGKGLMRLHHGRISRLAAPSLLPHNNVLALFEDRDGDLWIGTQGGLLRLSPSVAATITTADDEPQSINSIYQDPQGVLYVTALNGRLFRVAGLTLIPVDLPHGASRSPIRNVFRDSRGSLWIGTDGQGIIRLDEKGVERYTTRQGLVNDFIRAFYEDRTGALWIGTDSGLSRWQFDRFQNFKIPDGLVYNSLRALLGDRNGVLWIATEGGLSRFEGGRFVADPALERFRGQKVRALHEDPEGGLWIGTFGAGLFLYKNGTLSEFTTRMGLPGDKIHFIAEDAKHNLWMSGPNGIVSVSRRELEVLAGQPAGRLAVRIYGRGEGLITNQMNGGVQPAGALLASGQLWFPSARGAVRIDPDQEPRRGAPPVIIEQALSDDRLIPFSGGVTLPPDRRKLEIRYTAIRLRSPERIRFKYRLEGFDREWTDAGQRRTAYYTNLPSGNYRFQVLAYELDNPSQTTEGTLRVRAEPYFHQTTWFLAVCVCGALCVIGGGYWLHLRNLQKRFAAVLEERNRLAREMHDTLIQGCVGVSALLEAASSAQTVSPKISADLLDRARNEVRSTVDEARLAVWNLRHGSGEGLVAALSQLTHRLSIEAGVPVRFESSGAPLPLEPENERSLLMIIREALLNALRHASPKQLSVLLSFDRRSLQVRIEDDGCGFDASTLHSPDSPYSGLIGMRERAESLGAQFLITSSPGSGTQVRMTVPAPKHVAPQ